MTQAATAIKDALAMWERSETEKRRREAEEQGLPPPTDPASEEEVVRLCGIMPPIAKLDKDIQICRRVVHLSLSTNSIDKIPPVFREMTALRTLSLGRNVIKKLENLELPNLEQLWISYNRIEKLAGIEKLRSLEVLYMSNNLVTSWSEIERYLPQLPSLRDFLFIGNPLHKSMQAQEKEYRLAVLIRLPNLHKLDGRAFELEEREEAEQMRTQ